MADSWFRRLLGAPDRSGRRQNPVRTPEPARASTVSRTNAFQAVGVIACSQGCSAVGQAKGVRFLARQAPRLPLPDCDRAANCRCRFEKFADRRTLVQRSPYNNAALYISAGAEKRGNRDRRSGDR